MIGIRVFVAGLVCSVIPLSSASGQEPEAPESAPALLTVPDAEEGIPASVDLSVDLTSAYVTEPLAFDGGMHSLQGVPDIVFKEGPYIVGYVGYQNFGGDFNGDVILTGVDPSYPDLILVPEVDDGIGFGAGLGYRFGEFALEFNYMRTTHDADFPGSTIGDATLNLVNIDVKYFFMTDSPLQPMILVGLAIPWLDVGDGSIVIATGESGDSNFTGVGLNLGGGVNYFLTPQVALTAQAGYRFLWFMDVKGASNDRANIRGDYLEGFGFFLMAGVSYTF